MTSSSTTSSRGVVLSEAEILGTLNMDCACCICFQPPRPECAVLVQPCQHLFCSDCLTQAMSKKAECPVDRTTIDGDRVRVEHADEQTLALVRAVGVQCSSRRRGCTWEGTWGEWVDTSHATNCPFRQESVCEVPGCSNAEDPSQEIIGEHDRLFVHAHVRLLASAVQTLQEQNRSLRWEVDQLKERLYSAQNDITDWQHTSRREREEAGSRVGRLQQQLDAWTQNTRPLFPPFIVPGVSNASDASESEPPRRREWDAQCCSRSTRVEENALQHNGSVRGWATGFSRNGVAVRRGMSRVVAQVQFQLHLTSPEAPPPPSMIMIGLAVYRPSTSISPTHHVGSLPGCWAYQGSGFVWDGNIGRCGQLSPLSCAQESFGPGDIILLDLESTMNGCTIMCKKQTASNGDVPGGALTTIGVGGTIPFPQLDEIVLYPVVSLGAPNCSVSLLW
jgi:outer membrane murein-binding lipoprotein Lpp